MKRLLIAVSLLVSTVAFADVEIPTGLMNECGFRSLVASRIVASQVEGIEEDLIIAGLQLWMVMQLQFIDRQLFEDRPLSQSQVVISDWMLRVGDKGYMDWVQEVYDVHYASPEISVSKEWLSCQKELAGEK